jgi:hypothetical protein
MTQPTSSLITKTVATVIAVAAAFIVALLLHQIVAQIDAGYFVKRKLSLQKVEYILPVHRQQTDCRLERAVF